MRKQGIRNSLQKKEIYHFLLALVICSFLCLNLVPEADAAQNLVGAYGFNEGTGVSVADSSGIGNHGTITGATWSTAGKFGNALSFNGSSNLVTINDSASLDLTTGMTLEAWVYPTASGGYRTVLIKETPAGLAFGLYANGYTPGPSAWITKGGVYWGAESTTSLSLNTWTHLAATYNGTILRLYVNGTQVASKSVTGSIDVSSMPACVGGSATWGEYFQGRIDELRVYNTALTSTQIQADMNSAIVPPGSDTSPPTVASVSPSAGATGVSLATQVTANLSEAMSASTITSSTFELRNSGGVVAGTVSYDSATMKATLTPSSALVNSTTYTATVTTGVKDVAGNAMVANYTWSFTTVGDTTRPTVTSVSPLSGATGVSLGTQVTANFSEAMSASTITSSTFELRNSGGVVAGTVSYDSATMKATLTPSSALVNSTTYTATVTTGVKDVAGNAMVANYTWSFTTVADTTRPTVTSVSPLSGATGVSLATQVTATFSEAMNASTITSSTFELRNSGSLVAATVTYDSSTRQATLTPSVPLGYLTTYTATVTTGVKDVAGNAMASNYTWSFTTIRDTTPPTVTSVSPPSGAAGVSAGTRVNVTFSKAMSPTTITSSTFSLRSSSGATVSATVNYSSSTNTATLVPSNSLANSTTYTATVSTGVQDVAGNALAAAYNWSFTTVSAGPIGDGPGGPILVISSESNPFSRYYGEILLAEGFNSFYMEDISAVSAATLSNYEVVILGAVPITASQVAMITNWVTAGGNLIAMRPDKQLAGLLGLSDAGTTLSEGYLLVNTSAGPGLGIVGQTMQFHGTADGYTLAGASSLANLYSGSTTATSNPAVSLRTVGSSGGQAAAFTFDLAKSIVYTRQGNPAWAGQERDGIAPIRSDDLFYPDWINLNKVSIPQADEQQRLLANMIIQMNSDKTPLPRFWYFPDMLEAVVVMTGDDHGFDGTLGRFNEYYNDSPANCSVEDWGCIRSTSYIYPDPSGAMTDAQALASTNSGFEVGLHLNTVCSDFTPASLRTYFTQQLSAWKTMYPSLPLPKTHRAHCIVWSDYTSMAEVEFDNGIRLDVNYYYWPPNWIGDKPGFFTGSGLPMRFAKSDGSIIDVYQAPTQMTDESGQSYPLTVNSLLDKATGSEGYYGAFVANIHTDSSASTLSDLIVASATERGVPIISARQLLTWIEARNGSFIKNPAWNGNVLSFAVEANASARNLQTMVPIPEGHSVGYVKQDGSSIAYYLRIIKGIQYAIFASGTGDYEISLASDDTAPTVTSVLPASGAAGVSVDSSISITFSEAMDPGTITQSSVKLLDSLNNAVAGTVTYDSATLKAVLTPSARFKSLTTYTATVVGGSAGVTDVAGNSLASDYVWTFTAADLGTQESYSIWNDSAVPAVPSSSDTSAVELGLKFKSTIDGYVMGIRFYKGTGNTGTHIGNLWTQSGTLLGSVAFTNETASGWQRQAFTTPVPISANVTYVVSYHNTAGRYSYSLDYFSTGGVDNSPLRALSNSESGGNGVYRYGTSSGFPSQSWSSSNYWVDVVFQGSLAPDTTPPTVSSVNPANLATGVGTSSTVSAKFSEAMDPATIDGVTFNLKAAGGSPAAATVSYNVATKTATLVPAAALAPESVYTATLTTGIKDLTGNSLAATYTWSFTTAASGTPTTFSIWEDTDVPSVLSASDTAAVELGLKFQSSVPGRITGILFYKGAGNTGTHVGRLSTASGTMLASVTFTNETASGWQYQALTTPVAITANTTYLVSYYAPKGGYSVDLGYFATSGVDSYPLRALSNSESGGNGVYRYGAGGGFPTQTWSSSNYWVDVEFQE
jgi:hypothetical protein